jgi:hypothetical protein
MFVWHDAERHVARASAACRDAAGDFGRHVERARIGRLQGCPERDRFYAWAAQALEIGRQAPPLPTPGAE